MVEIHTKRANRPPADLVRSRKQESRIAKRLGGKVTRGSGNGIEKGDVRIKGLARIEAKTTRHKSFSVTQEMLDKIENAAVMAGELPVLAIEFAGGDRVRTVCVVPEWVLDALVEAYDGAN